MKLPETQGDMLAYAIRITTDMEQRAFALAADLGEQDNDLDGSALDIAIHLSRVLRRLRKLQVQETAP